MVKFIALVFCVWAAAHVSVIAESRPNEAQLSEPGPEALGLRLRLSVAPRAEPALAGYRVRVDLVNVSAEAILLRANLRFDGAESFQDYLEAAIGIECTPAVAPWIGGVAQGRRTEPQPEHRLAPGETISASWETDQPRLKNRVLNPNEVQNPTFPFPGLYSTRAVLEVITANGTALLHSNEQQVPVGGSRAMPRPTMGTLYSVDGEKKTGTLSLGTLHQVAIGDQFEIGSPKGMHWKLTITGADSRWSWGNLELLTTSKYPPYSNPPPQNTTAVLVRPK
jgi:hypothetical protein